MADVSSKVLKSHCLALPGVFDANCNVYVEHVRAARYDFPSRPCFQAHNVLNQIPGNDPDLDDDRNLEPSKVADKPTERRGKRDAPDNAPNDAPTGPRVNAGGRGGRGGGRGGSDQGETSTDVDERIVEYYALEVIHNTYLHIL